MATIATQLYNAKDPMSRFELQAWLGHSNPSSTQHYARITPLTLTKPYTDAGYFARNVRTIRGVAGLAGTPTPSGESPLRIIRREQPASGDRQEGMP